MNNQPASLTQDQPSQSLGGPASTSRIAWAIGRTGWQATLLVSLASLLVQALAYLRDVSLAYQAGASSFSDIVFVAVTIPTIITSAFANSVLVPIVVEAVVRRLSAGQEEAAWDTASALFNLIILLAVPMVALILIFPRELVGLIAPGFKPEEVAESALVLQLGVVAAGLSLMSAWATGLLNATGRFFLAAVSPAVVHIPVFLSILIFFHLFGPAVVGTGMLVGALLQVGLLLAITAKIGFRYRPILRTDADSGNLWAPAASMLAVLALGQVYLIVERWLASGLATGGVSLLSYALKLAQWPVTLFALPVGVTALPLFADLHSQRSPEMLRTAVLSRLRWMLVMSLPLMGWLIIESGPLASLVYQRGALSPADAEAIGQLLALYALGLPALSCSTILLRAGLAVRILRFLPIAVALAAGLYTFAAFQLSSSVGLSGLALALSIYHWVLAGLFLVGMRRWLRPINFIGALTFLIRLGLAAGLSVLAMVALTYWWPTYLSSGLFGRLALLLATAFVGMVVFLVAGRSLNLQETNSIIRRSYSLLRRGVAR